MYYHIDKDGNKTKLEDLKLSHLKNIISYIDRKAIQGVTIMYGGSGCCAEDMWYDEEEIFGDKVRDAMKYDKYKKELKRRDG